MEKNSVVMLASPGPLSNMAYHALGSGFFIEWVLMEEPLTRGELLRRRVKTLGYWTVLGQVLFQLLAVPCLKRLSRRRMAELKKAHDLDDSPIDEAKLLRVPSINSEMTAAYLKMARPRVVVVQGTRIISPEILKCVPATFINMHTGITPLYRGVHGAYWALVENNRKACGVTVHLVDAGIDTGPVIAQAVIEPGPEDNYATYAALQFAAGLPLLKQAVAEALAGRLKTKPNPDGGSKLRTHPTLWGYLWNRMIHGVK